MPQEPTPPPSIEALQRERTWDQKLLDLITGKTAAQKEKDRLKPPATITGVRG